MEFSSEEILALDELANHAGAVYGSISRFGKCYSAYLQNKAELETARQTLRDAQIRLEEWTTKEIHAYDEYEAYRYDSSKLRNRLYVDWDYATRRKLHYQDEIKTQAEKIEALETIIKEQEAEIERLYAETFSSCDGLVEYYTKLRSGDTPETRPHSPYEESPYKK